LIGTEPLDPGAPLEEIMIEDVNDRLSEDPEDTPAMLISTIELHIASLQKAGTLLTAILPILKQKYDEGIHQT